jgi:hypothetical protein
MKTLAQPADIFKIRTRLASLAPADRGLWGHMTVHQMICHLRDAFGCPMGERAVKPIAGPPIPRSLYKWLALNFPRKWPHGVPTTPEMNQQVGGTPPVEFAADLEALLRKLDQFATARGPWSPHPMFGPMTTTEWMRWGYLHTDHHLRQFGR